MNSRREISSRFTNDICLVTQMAWCQISTNRKKSKDWNLINSEQSLFSRSESELKNGENNGVLAGIPFLSPSRAPRALAHATKFPLPLPLLTPATQAKLICAFPSSRVSACSLYLQCFVVIFVHDMKAMGIRLGQHGYQYNYCWNDCKMNKI